MQNQLLYLFQELNKYLDIYIKAYTTYRLQIKKENVESKKQAALEQMEDALLMIEDVINRIDSYYQEQSGQFASTISKEDIEIIEDEYIETLTRIDNVEVSLSLNSIQTIPEIVECHKKLLSKFEIMEDNIKFYNNRNLGYKIISPEEAHKYYLNMRKQIRENRYI